MTTKAKSSGGQRPRKGSGAATPADSGPVEGTTLTVPVRGPELAWLGARLTEVGRGWKGGAEAPPVTLLLRREALTAILWDRHADLGVVATITPAGLVDAVDDLPPGGLVAEVGLQAFAKLAKAHKGAGTVPFKVSGTAVTIGTYKVVRPLASEPTAPPLGASGPVAHLDGRDLARAIGVAGSFADDSSPVLLSFADGGLSVLGGGQYRFVRATVAADTPEPIETALPAAAAKIAQRLLKRSTGRATIQVTDGLVTLTGQWDISGGPTPRQGSLGVICRRADDSAMLGRVADLFSSIDGRAPSLLAQVDARDLKLAIKRGQPLAHLHEGVEHMTGPRGAPLTTILTSDAAGLLMGHMLASDVDSDPTHKTLHAEPIEGWTVGRGSVALNPKLLRGLLPTSGPVVLDCGGTADPIRVRVVDGAVSLDTIVMPFAPNMAAHWGARVRGEPVAAQPATVVAVAS